MANIRVNQLYLAAVVIPQELNAPSPVASSLPVMDVGQGTQILTSIRKHFCILIRYDPITRVGVLFLGSTQPEHPHRFVPCAGTPRLDYQPLYEVGFADDNNLRQHGYFNFSHALRATLVFPGDLVQPSTPLQVFCKDTFGDGTPLAIYVNAAEVKYMRHLHSEYWDGVRYTKQGNRITEKGGLVYPIQGDGTVVVPEAMCQRHLGSAGERLSRALEEEDERMYQLMMMDAEAKDLPAPEIVCYLAPWSVDALRLSLTCS